MPRRASSAPLLGLARDSLAGGVAGGVALHRQLYGQVRELVLSGRLAPGARLPSSRGLARDLGCGRNAVVAAYDQVRGAHVLTEYGVEHGLPRTGVAH
ncbi:MAG: GntR family transcriptional regulator [Proteobacteria bacterium]|nr:GntR family transcriptional regulator [Pseudomonadota bacterium]